MGRTILHRIGHKVNHAQMLKLASRRSICDRGSLIAFDFHHIIFTSHQTFSSSYILARWKCSSCITSAFHNAMTEASSSVGET